MPPITPGAPPPAELAIDESLVRSLLNEQHPELASLPLTSLPLTRAAEGWDNVTFRLGSELAVRLPRRSAAASLVVHEQRWLPALAPRLFLPVPAPTHVGVPSPHFPWHWSVVPWIAGASALDAPLPASEAPVLGRFLRELHAVAITDEAPRNPYRGVPLRNRSVGDTARLSRLREAGAADDELEVLAELLSGGADIPLDTADAWLHGDLHAKNVLSRDGALAAVIDWGDICIGDPATDLAAVWNLFEVETHERFWHAYGEVSAETRSRAAVWAATFGLMLWDSHHQVDPDFAALGLRSLRRVAATV